MDSAFKSQEVDVSGLGKYCNTTHVLNVSLAVSVRSLAIQTLKSMYHVHFITARENILFH